MVLAHFLFIIFVAAFYAILLLLRFLGEEDIIFRLAQAISDHAAITLVRVFMWLLVSLIVLLPAAGLAYALYPLLVLFSTLPFIPFELGSSFQPLSAWLMVRSLILLYIAFLLTIDYIRADNDITNFLRLFQHSLWLALYLVVEALLVVCLIDIYGVDLSTVSNLLLVGSLLVLVYLPLFIHWSQKRGTPLLPHTYRRSEAT